MTECGVSIQKYILQAREIGQQRRDEFERLSDEKQYELVNEAKQLISSRKKRAKRAKLRDVSIQAVYYSAISM